MKTSIPNASRLIPESQHAHRRQFLRWGVVGGAMLFTPIGGMADVDGDVDSNNQSGTGSNHYFNLLQTALTGHVVIIGGGMAGATAAKYLRLWGGSGIKVTLVEPSAEYTSNIMSNLVLNGTRTITSLKYVYTALVNRYGINYQQARVNAINPNLNTVSLDNGSTIAYDRLIVATGVEFMSAYGLSLSDYDNKTPHAWQAGAQTSLLQSQITVMKNGETFVMTIPPAPYRCPPGPYERACLVADYLKTTGRSACKVVVLDENLSIQAQVNTFTTAFNQTHQGIIQYVAGAKNIQINPDSKVVNYLDGVDTPQTINATVVNPIPPHRARGSDAGGILANAGLNNSADGKWAKVNVLSYASTAQPNIHIIGDAAQCGLPKAGHVANQEAKICADALVRIFGGQSPDSSPVANSACYSPITANTASWLTAVFQYDSATGTMKVANKGGNTAGAAAVESATVSARYYQQMVTWYTSLMKDTFS